MNSDYEKRREYYRQRYLLNKERLLNQTKAYQATHPEVVKRASKKYAAANRERISDKRRERYAADPEKSYQTHRSWVKRNAVKRSDYMREWRKRQCEHRKLYDASYRVAHKDQRSDNQNARRARQIGNGGSHTKEQWAALKEAFEHRCGYCGTGGRLSKDHALPLARGGTDDIANIIPACLPCNQRKHSKTAEEFMAILKCSPSA